MTYLGTHFHEFVRLPLGISGRDTVAQACNSGSHLPRPAQQGVHSSITREPHKFNKNNVTDTLGHTESD